MLHYLSGLQIKVDTSFSQSALFASQREMLRKQTHFTFNSDFIQNFNPNQQDVEDNILYQRRYQNGLEWNIMKDGFFESRAKLRSVDLEELFLKELERYSYKRTHFPIKMNQTIFAFNAKKMALLKEREDLLNKQRELLEKLYFSKKITKEKMLELHSKLAEIEALKAIYGTYSSMGNQEMDSLILKAGFGLFDIKYSQIEQELTHNSDSLKSKMLEDLERQNQWFREIRFKTFLRHSFYDLVTTAPSSRSFMSAGFNLAIPLTFNRKESLESEKQALYKRFESLNTNGLNVEIDVLNECYEYRYHLKQYVLFYQKKQLALENLRQERVKAKFQDADYNPINALNYLDQLYQIEVELLDLQQNLYIRILKIHEKTKAQKVESLLLPFDLPNFDELESKINRTVYIWSKSFEEHSLDFITEYLSYNQFDEVELAVSPEDEHLEDKKKLIDALFQKNVKVYLMFGQNTLLNEANKKEYLLDCLKQYPLSKVSGIHLDVEPHTLKEWDTDKKKLQESYLSLAKQAKTIASDYKMKLTVDLPVYLDSSYLRSIAEQVDGMRFMCYENIRKEYLLRKLEPVKNLNKTFSVSLRTEDFSNRIEMEKFSKELCKELGISTVNFHDLSRLITLDRKAIEEDEEH